MLLVIGVISSLWISKGALTSGCRDAHPWLLLQHHCGTHSPSWSWGPVQVPGELNHTLKHQDFTGQVKTSVSAKVSLVSDPRSRAKISGLPLRKMPIPWQVSFQHAEEKRSQILKILLQKPGKASQVVTMCSHRSPFGCQTTTFSCLPLPGCFPNQMTSTFLLMLFPAPHFPVSRTCHPANCQFLWSFSQFSHYLDSSKSIQARWAGGC